MNMIEPTIDAKYFRSGFRKGHVIGMHVLADLSADFGGRVAPPFNRFYMGGENDVRGFESGVSVRSHSFRAKPQVQVLNNDGSARQQRFVDSTGRKFFHRFCRTFRLTSSFFLAAIPRP